MGAIRTRLRTNVNVFALVVFVGLPTVVAFAALSGLPAAPTAAPPFGLLSAILAAVGIAAYGWLFQRLYDREWTRPVAKTWAVISIGLALTFSIIYRVSR